MKIEDIKKLITKDKLTDLYSNQFMSCEDIGKYFGVYKTTISKLVKEWGIERDQKAFNRHKAFKSASHKDTPFKNFSSDQVEELKDLYLNQNKTYEEVKNYFGLKGSTLDKILNTYDIHKSKSISAHKGLQTKYENAGSKEAYFKHLDSIRKDNYIKKAGSLEDYYKSISGKCSEAWSSKSWEEKKRLNSISMSHGAGWNHDKSKQTLMDKYGVDNAYKLSSYTSNSLPNQEFASKLSAANILYQPEFYITTPELNGRGFRYDFKVDQTLIEIDPWPFHNTTFNPIASQSPISKDYHLKKSKAANAAGYRCIHIFDWEDQDKIIQSLQSKTKIHARDCDLREVSMEDSEIFLNQYHFQNSCKGQKVRLGLYYKKSLIELMTFGTPRYNKKYQWELLRLCTKFGNYVVGGAERLYSYFLKNFNPKSIISYCDRSKFAGDVYSRLGMTLIRTGAPSKHWYNYQLDIHVTDNLLRQRGFDQLYGTVFGCYGKGASNEDLMRDHNFVEIYDCGQQSFGWNSFSVDA